MIQSIQKETFVEADEQTTKSLTYDILKGLYEKMDELTKVHHNHTQHCDTRFKVLEERKLKDTTLASIFGVAGGFLAIVAQWVKQWLTH